MNVRALALAAVAASVLAGTAPAASPSEGAAWLHVRVEEPRPGSRGSRVHVNLPMAAVEAARLGKKVVLIEPGAFKTDIWTRNVIVVSEATSDSSPNKERTQRFGESVSGSTKEMPDPIEVARLIARVAQNRNPRLRYLAGKDAKIGYLLRAILPWKLWEGMVERNSRID